MADGSQSDQERSLPATARRLEQAREEGQIPRSRALASALVLITALLTLWAAGPMVTAGLSRLMAKGLSFDHTAVFGEPAPLERLLESSLHGLMVGLPVCGALTGAAILATFGVGGWNFTTSAWALNWSRIDPIGGLKRMLSLSGLVESGKTLIEVFAVTMVVAIFVWNSLDDIAAILLPSGNGPMAVAVALVRSGFAAMVCVLIASAAMDVPLQIWRHGHGLRMSLDEVKRETRESEGDPQIKAKIRSTQREMAKKRMMQDVPKADVVITNPNRYAVALRYDKHAAGAPRVVAKGVDAIAARIREIARDANVPLVEVPPLARALYAKTAIGAEIPHALYAACAHVLAFVFQIKTESNGSLPGRTPYVLTDVDVPVELDPAHANGGG